MCTDSRFNPLDDPSWGQAGGETRDKEGRPSIAPRPPNNAMLKNIMISYELKVLHELSSRGGRRDLEKT